MTEGQLDLVYLHGGSVCCTTAINGMDYFARNTETGTAVYEEAYEAPAEEVYTEPEPVEEEPAPAEDEGFWLWPELMAESETELNMPTNDDWLTME